jgi:pimeloyl-ACP methyl ester carboxylesterase
LQRRISLDDGAFTTLESWGERGPILLAVHGMTSSRRSWTRLARHLGGRFRVIAYDQRGHGDSAEVDGPMRLARGVRDAQNVIAALDEPIDTLLGHSWGGAIAILAGSDAEVMRVATIDPMIRQVGDAWYQEYLDELAEAFRMTGEKRDAATRREYADWDPADVAGKVHAVHTMTTRPIEGLWKENPPAAWDLRGAIAAYAKPLLLVFPPPGESINPDATLDEVERRHSKNVTIVRVPQGGHNLHRTHFASFAEALDQWVAV